MFTKIDSMKEEEIVNLFDSGLSYREITKVTQSHYSTVKRVLTERGKFTYSRQKKVRVPTDTGFICSKCQEDKDQNQFKGNLSYCRTCANKDNIKNLNTNLLKVLKLRIKNLKRKSSVVEVDENFLKEVYECQAGLCFYTDEPLDWTQGQGLTPNTLTVDKIIPEKGYVEGNVVLCTHKSNTVKSYLSLEELEKWIPTWYNRVYDKLHQG